MTTTPADPPLPHAERKSQIWKFSDQEYIRRQCYEAYADELHALLESERSEHAKTREERDALAAKLEAREKLFADAMQLVAEYEAQWGGDYLAEKWGLVEERKRLETAGKEGT